MIKNTVELSLHYGGLTLGQIREAFSSDGTWYGVFVPVITTRDGPLAEQLLAYVEFSEDWNERVRNELSADADEFQRYADIVKSGLWSTQTEEGDTTSVMDAPVFFSGGDVSWTANEGQVESRK